MKIVTRKKTVVQEYNVYIAEDGKEFKTYDECKDYDEKKRGNRITCPDCNGKGRVNEHSEQVFDGGLYGDHKYHTYWTSDPCPRCKGKGYLEKKLTWE